MAQLSRRVHLPRRGSARVLTPHLPGVLHRGFGLTCSALTRRYSRNHNCFLFRPLLKCFSSGGSRSHQVAGARRGISPAHDVAFGNPGINACVQLPRAFRSLPRPSSVPKPRYPPHGVGVSSRNQERAQCAPASASRPGPRYSSLKITTPHRATRRDARKRLL